MYNKEALRKELEDVFWTGWNICERYHNGDSTGYENKIPSNWIQMDGDGGKLVSVVEEIVNAIEDFEIPITLHQGKFPARTINLPESTFIRMKEALASVLLPEINSNVMEWDYCDECKKLVIGIARGTDEEYFQTECPECDSITTKIDVSELFKRIQFKPLADGQEGKGPELFITDESVKAGNEMANKLFAEDDKEFNKPAVTCGVKDCSNHNKHLFGQTDMKVVAEAISNLHYESLVNLLGFMEGKLCIDAMNDNRNGRQKLAKALYRTVQGINSARKGIEDAWEISKPFMDEGQPAQGKSPTLTPLQIWNKAIMVADNVCQNRVNIFKDGWMNGWTRVEDDLPKPVSGEDNSENVFAIVDGKLRVMAYCYIALDENSGWAWCDCAGQIDGDPEFDDDYKVTHWMPLPRTPNENPSPNPKVDAIELCRKEIMQYFNDQYHIKKMLGTEPPEDNGPVKMG